MPLLFWRSPATNRKLKQRRPLRARMPGRAAVGRAVRDGLVAAAPFLLGAAGFFGLVLGGVAGYRWLTTSPRFALRAIAVSGNQHVSDAAIARRAGVAVGQNVFGVPLRAAEARIAQDPWIA